MRLRLILPILGILVPTLGFAEPGDQGDKWSNRCVVVFSDTFKYEEATLPQQKTGENLYKRVIVAVCWWKGQENYTVKTGEHLFREYHDKGKLVREGVGEWTFPSKVYLSKGAADEVRWMAGDAMVDATPFDEPYKEE